MDSCFKLYLTFSSLVIRTAMDLFLSHHEMALSLKPHPKPVNQNTFTTSLPWLCYKSLHGSDTEPLLYAVLVLVLVCFFFFFRKEGNSKNIKLNIFRLDLCERLMTQLFSGQGYFLQDGTYLQSRNMDFSKNTMIKCVKGERY